MDSDSALGEKTVLDPPRLGLPVENPDFEMADVVEVEDAIVPFAGSETDGILPKDTSFGDPETRDANLSGARRVASLSTPEYDGPCRSPSQESFPVDGPLVEDSEMSNLKADQPESVASLGSTEAHPTTGGKTIWNTILPESQEENIDQGLSQPKDRLDALDVDFASGGQIPIPISPEWEEWEDSEDESEDAIGALSTDIRADFERVLNKPLDFQGSFYFHKTYSEFPNPILRLGSLGHIGLPLSSREAEHIKVHCVQAPFGKGERTLVDKSVRDTWEMDASQVHFDNPAWKTFMVQVSQEVCLKLGLAAKQVSTVRCEPYKLLLYETGSHFLPHQDTEKTKGMFATVIVVLPSPFQGGAAHLSHGDLSTIVDSSPCSLSNVSVLAWYTDVLHEIKPITGGHRLAVAFNLIQTASSRPELPKTDDHLRKLKHVLLSWKQRTDVPDKLMYLLQHKYSLASLRGDCLKGADAYKVALLQSLAKQLDFDVGLANVECHVVGYGDDDFGHRGGYGSEDDDDVGMAEVEEQTMTISNLVDLEGQHIQKEVECKEDDSEFCPMGLRDEVEAGNPDEREYEGYQGNGAGSLELWYRRTVLVIWPHRHNAEMKYGTNPGRALAILTSAAKPDDECRLIARFLLRGIASGRFGPKTVQGLCKTACHWNNLTLWLKTISLCDRHANLEYNLRTSNCECNRGIWV
ncbi:hypothetical protein DFH09DRAFT_27215 [Mycena vulgaris]|nr:hypothetical protein DFH09DRAFT_27215 [Mycena vulgaris]